MNIAVCLKLIADPDIITFDVEKNELVDIHYVLDPVGNSVLEESLLLRQQYGGEVIALSVTPLMGESILMDSLRYGVDKAVRVWDDELQSTDAWQRSLALKHGIEKIGFDLILCGSKSKDSASGFMVHALAHHLNVASATGIIAIEKLNDHTLKVVKKLQKGCRETYTLRLPAVLGIEEDINEPRYVAMFSDSYRKGMEKKVTLMKVDMKCLKKPLTECLGFSQPRPRVKAGINMSKLSMQDRLKMMRGEWARKKEIFGGSSDEAAIKIFDHIQRAAK